VSFPSNGRGSMRGFFSHQESAGLDVRVRIRKSQDVRPPGYAELVILWRMPFLYKKIKP